MDNSTDAPREIFLEDLLSTVREAYSPEIAEALRAELALVASLSYSDLPCCLALILEGPSGVGKSALVEMLNPIKENDKYLRREDRFTAAAFVSNASNVKKEKLKDIDLLPKIIDKTMLTKELSPMFGNDDKALRDIFGTITSVLDGKGYRTATGTHGERGYSGECRFNWIGATTPIPTRVHNIMALFGCRLLFYECRFPEPSYEEVLAKMKNGSSYEMRRGCNSLVNTFLSQHFERFGVKTLHEADIEIPDDIFRELYDYVMLMTLGRRAIFPEDNGTIQNNGDDPDEAAEIKFHVSPPESPYRPLDMLRCIAIGSALIARRRTVTADDIAIVRHIALSSMPDKRRMLLRRLIRAGGRIDSSEVAERLRCSKPTALKWMQELAATELCEFRKNEKGSNQANHITLKEEFRFLTRTPFDLIDGY